MNSFTSNIGIHFKKNKDINIVNTNFNLSASANTQSSISVSFTAPSSYTVVSYTLSLIPQVGDILKTTFTTPQSLYKFTGLYFNMNYTILLKALTNTGITLQSSIPYNTTSIVSFTTQPSIIGTTSTGYNIYVFKDPSSSCVMTYTNNIPVNMYALVVGGGGSGGSNTSSMGGGGGGGGVVKKSIILSQSDTLTFSVGKGGVAGNNTGDLSGGNSSIIFTSVTGNNAIAIGGGRGGNFQTAPISGGSGGGGTGAGSAYSTGAAKLALATTYNNFGNAGGNAPDAGVGGGGGGANTAGKYGNVSTTINSILYYGNGGDGIGHSDLSGICDYSPYIGLYWGGGGGGGSSGNLARNAGCGGLGGGGGGATYSSSTASYGLGGSSALNSGANGRYRFGGNAGANTGGGGGGQSGNSTSGNGGSGIIVIALKTMSLNPPTNLSAISNTISSISISFTQPSGIINGTIQNYTVIAVPTSGSTVTKTFTGTTYTITGLQSGINGISYTITVKATDNYVTSEPSNSITYSTAAIPTPTLLWDANANITQASNLVSSWGNSSNSYFATQSNNSYKPTITTDYITTGKSAVVYTENSNKVLTTGSISTPMGSTSNITFFFVFKIVSNSSMQNFLSSSGNWVSGCMHLIFTGGKFQLSLNAGSNDFGTNVSVPINTSFILMVNFSSATGSMVSYLRLNGTSSSSFTHTNSVVTLVTNSFDFGGWSSGGRTINGGIGEIVIYNRTLNLTEIKNVEAYLSSKYGITVSTA